AEQERLRKEAEAAAARADARGRARAYLSSAQRTPIGAWELSKELDKATAEQQDAVYRLLYFAASGNVAESFVSYARCLDPAEPAWGSIKKDAAEAWEYYRKAGTPEAAEAMKKMKEWTEAAAKAGNRDAAAWLRLMK
ncbi:MAG: hypothetical protein J5838_06415, partial [Desulfovibrio sp.]|nr:hypothetical protein [Desulfovibrio sp.]